MTHLQDLINDRDALIEEGARINSVFSQLDRTFPAKRAELEAIGEQLGAAEAALLLGESTEAAVTELSERFEAASKEAKRHIGTAKALLVRKERVAEAIRDAKLAVASEAAAIAWPAWDELSRDAVEKFGAALSAIRKRLQLGASVEQAYSRAGELQDPFDINSAERGRFFSEFGLDVDGLADLVGRHELKLTSSGLGFLPSGSIELLNEADLLALAKAAEAKQLKAEPAE